MSTGFYAYKKEFNEDGSEKHVVENGARFHVVSYNAKDGAVCSQPSCEINKKNLVSQEQVAPVVDIAQIIQKEIDYHKDHRGESGYVSTWENGFLKGLLHIREILEKCQS